MNFSDFTQCTTQIQLKPADFGKLSGKAPVPMKFLGWLEIQI